MGVDLCLIPKEKGAIAAFSLLEMDRDSDLFEHISKLEKDKGIEVARGGFNSHTGRNKQGDTAYGKTELTPYGNRMKSVEAKELYVCLVSYNFEPLSQTNGAIMMYLRCINPETEIYLYWH